MLNDTSLLILLPLRTQKSQAVLPKKQHVTTTSALSTRRCRELPSLVDRPRVRGGALCMGYGPVRLVKC